MGAKVIQVIVTDDLKVGTGDPKGDDPIRLVVQYYTLDGERLALIDPYKDGDRFYNPMHEKTTICR